MWCSKDHWPKNVHYTLKFYFASECTDKGGSPKGKCAAGFGICCVFTLRGDDSTQEVNNNDTYIQNPGFPTVYTDSSGLSYTVNKCKDGKCLIVLEWTVFEVQFYWRDRTWLEK